MHHTTDRIAQPMLSHLWSTVYLKKKSICCILLTYYELPYFMHKHNQLLHCFKLHLLIRHTFIRKRNYTFCTIFSLDILSRLKKCKFKINWKQNLFQYFLGMSLTNKIFLFLYFRSLRGTCSWNFIMYVYK